MDAAEDEGLRQVQHTNAELQRRQELLVDAYDEMMLETEAQAEYIQRLEQQLRAQRLLADSRKESAAEVGELSGDLIETRQRLKATQVELSTKAEQLLE
eukprot:gene22191-13710_t